MGVRRKFLRPTSQKGDIVVLCEGPGDVISADGEVIEGAFSPGVDEGRDQRGVRRPAS